MSGKRKRSESDKELMKMLKFYQSDGISIFFEDHPSTPQEVVNKMMIHEDEVFMGDYIMNPYGRLVQIRFDPVVI